MELDYISKQKEYLFARQQAYKHVFNIQSEFVKTVMEDLEKFCRGSQSTFDSDARIHALLEGRREVYLRIENNLKLASEDLWKLHSNQKG